MIFKRMFFIRWRNSRESKILRDVDGKIVDIFILCDEI
jgi:hypothetical protein